jgi:cell division septation protein DedD
MLEPILPRAGLVQTDYAMTLPASSSLATAAVAPPMHEADFEDVSFAPATDYAPARRFQTDDVAPAPPRPFVPPGQYQEPEPFIAPDQYEDHDPGATPAAMPTAPSTMPPAHFDDAAAPEFNPVTVGRTGDLRTDTALAELERLAPLAPVHTADADLHQPMAAEAEAPAVSADPWDDPLPAWEYSHNEWPMLADKQKVSTASKLKWPLIVAGVIVLAIVIAAAYIFFKPRRELPAAQAPLTVQPNIQQPAAAPPATTPAATTQPAPTASTNAEAPAAPTNSANANKADTSATASSATDGQWKNSLQVMASPNEGEANAEAERLKNAGIAAYVVRADLGGHGVWYRVRIGRFTSPEEAQRFTNEVRARARAANLTLKNLQVTGYDKP